MGKFSRDKGMRAERNIVGRYIEMDGVFARRVPLSGAQEGYPGDVSVEVGPHKWTIEVKARADGFRELYKWTSGVDVVHVVADRKEPLAVVPWWLWKCICEKLAKEAYYDSDFLATVDPKHQGGL